MGEEETLRQDDFSVNFRSKRYQSVATFFRQKASLMTFMDSLKWALVSHL